MVHVSDCSNESLHTLRGNASMKSCGNPKADARFDTSEPCSVSIGAIPDIVRLSLVLNWRSRCSCCGIRSELAPCTVAAAVRSAALAIPPLRFLLSNFFGVLNSVRRFVLFTV